MVSTNVVEISEIYPSSTIFKTSSLILVPRQIFERLEERLLEIAAIRQKHPEWSEQINRKLRDMSRRIKNASAVASALA